VNQLKVGAVLSYLSMGLGYIVSLIYTPLMLRLLGQSEYGLYNLVASVVAYLGILNFGFGSAYIRYYSRYKVQDDKARISNLNAMFLVIFSTIGLVAVIAGIGIAINTEVVFGSELSNSELSKAKILMIILVVNLAISFPSIVFTSNITANEKFVFQKIIEMIRTVANPFVVLPLLIMGYGSVGMVIATTFLNVTVEIIYVVYCIRKLKMRFSFSRFDYSLMREMTVFSSYIFINLLIDQINWNVDKFILGRYRGTVSVAVYGLASQLNTYYLSIATAISSVFIPRVHRIVVDSDSNSELTALFTRIGRLQFIILSLISSGLVFFGRPFINMWAGENYDGAYRIVLMLIIPVTIPLIQTLGIEIQRAKNMHKFRSWVYLFIAIGNLIITIPLVRMYGGVGAATGTAVSLIVGNGVLMNWYNHRKVGLDMKYFWKQIFYLFPSLIIPILSGVFFRNFINLYNQVYFVVFGILYVAIFFVSMWRFGMNDYEKNIFGKLFRKKH
jgi:O-antigen/teichoic acid export membrane protein